MNFRTSTNFLHKWQRAILLTSVLTLFLGSSATRMAAAPLSGSYTINSAQATGGGNFQSFSDFADSLNTLGVSGNVTATVALGSGPYHEQVVFNNIPGAGPGATVTIEGNGQVITAVTSSTDRHVIRLTDVQYFTINNLEVAWDPTSTGGFYGIHIYNTGNHITISNCEVDLSGTTSTLYGSFVASGSLTSILTTGDFHNLTFTGNTATEGGYGVSVFGLVSNLASNIVISDNTIYDFHSNGIYLRETDGAQISGNFFDKRTSQVTSTNAIQIAQAANVNARIFNNEIQISQTSNGTQTIRGIYLFNGTGHKVYNNIIHNINLTSGNFTAIEVRTGGTAPEVSFNTIAMDNATATTGDLSGVKESLSNTNTVLRNNIFSISQPTSGIAAALVLSSSSTVTTALNSDYNLFWVPAGNVGYKANISTPIPYPTLANWQSNSGQDANSLSVDPQFVSPTLSVPSNTLANDAGTPIAGITTDFLGVTRGTPPDVGAYEFSGCTLPSQPGSISGDTILCYHTLGVNYSVAPVSGLLSYTWNLPPGANIVTGQGTNSITVDFGSFTGGFLISVTAVDTCGQSPPSTLPITLVGAPPIPGPITGNVKVCADAPGVTYSIAPVAGSTNYQWFVPNDATIVSGQGTTSIVLNYGSTPGTKTIVVKSENDCDTSGPRSLIVTVQAIPNVALVLPEDTLCSNALPLALSGGTPAGGFYFGPGVSNGMFDPAAAGLGNHTITYLFVDSIGCTDSAQQVITVEICAGITDIGGIEPSISPNPFSQTTTIRLPGINQPVEVQVYDNLGRLVQAVEFTDERITLSRNGLPAGMYLVVIRSGEALLGQKQVMIE